MKDMFIDFAMDGLKENAELAYENTEPMIDSIVNLTNELSINELSDYNTKTLKPASFSAEVDSLLGANKTWVEGNYTYHSDEFGRLDNVSGQIELGDGIRNQQAQLDAGGVSRLETDDGGHIIAREFGGSGELHNLVPMGSHLNRYGEYRQLETDIKGYIDQGYDVYGEYTIQYESDSQRPEFFEVEYTVDGEPFHEIIYNTVNS